MRAVTETPLCLPTTTAGGGSFAHQTASMAMGASYLVEARHRFLSYTQAQVCLVVRGHGGACSHQQALFVCMLYKQEGTPALDFTAPKDSENNTIECSATNP